MSAVYYQSHFQKGIICSFLTHWKMTILCIIRQFVRKTNNYYFCISWMSYTYNYFYCMYIVLILNCLMFKVGKVFAYALYVHMYVQSCIVNTFPLKKINNWHLKIGVQFTISFWFVSMVIYFLVKWGIQLITLFVPSSNFWCCDWMKTQ